MLPPHVNRARTALQGLIGEVRLIPEDGGLTAAVALDGGRLLGAECTKISVVAGACYGMSRKSHSQSASSSGPYMDWQRRLALVNFSMLSCGSQGLSWILTGLKFIEAEVRQPCPVLGRAFRERVAGVRFGTYLPTRVLCIQLK